jgi:hypothetical protein
VTDDYTVQVNAFECNETLQEHPWDINCWGKYSIIAIRPRQTMDMARHAPARPVQSSSPHTIAIIMTLHNGLKAIEGSRSGPSPVGGCCNMQHATTRASERRRRAKDTNMDQNHMDADACFGVVPRYSVLCFGDSETLRTRSSQSAWGWGDQCDGTLMIS